jgi:hypothetical protein
MAAIITLTYWMGMELLILVFLTFKRYNGLYFWTLITSTVGILIYNTAIIFVNFETPVSANATTITINIGWAITTLSYPLVLWSRLHLVIGHRPRLLKAILASILFVAIGSEATTLSVTWGVVFKHPELYHVQEVVNHVEGVIIGVQQLLISFVYIYQTAKFLKGGYAVHTKKVIGLLLVVQLLCICGDVGSEYQNFSKRLRWAAVTEPAVLSLKLRLEFIVLNQLRSIVKRGLAPGLSLGSAPQHSSSRPHIDGIGVATPLVEPTGTLPSPEIVVPIESPALSPSEGSGKSTTADGSATPEIEKSAIKGNDSQISGPIDRASVNELVEDSKVDDLEAMYLGRWRE